MSRAIVIGDVIGRYQIRRVIGAGGMGRVFLARDTTLGRSVALKLIRADGIGDANIEQFVVEARLTASLNHPHIVQLHDVGEYDGSPYLALEFIEGESLGARCAREQPSRDEALRMLRGIADALAHAHAAGVIHCDLKPSNIMLPNDGRLRVVDFGLARTTTSDASHRGGTPDWMSPEQWTNATITSATDIWALALIGFELLTGRHALGADRSTRREQALALDATDLVRDPAIPSPLWSLFGRSLRRESTARPTAHEWLELLDTVLDGRSTVFADDGPFRGLAAFDERHAHLFFGREAEIDQFVERLRSTPLLPVVGPSGAGKSSFVFAGVIPRLQARERWTVVAVRPGANPFGLLAQRVLELTGAVASSEERQRFADELRATPTLLSARLATLATATGKHVLLVVDQLEELFTQASDADASAFLRLLLAAADDPLEPVRVTCTVRDDFLGRLAGLRSLFVLEQLDREKLRRTIDGPIRRVGYRFEDDALLDEIVDDVGDDVAVKLPLLQFACRLLWEARDVEHRTISRAAYTRIGGVGGALASHADGVLDAMSNAERALVRQIMLALVVGTTRRQVNRASLLAESAGSSAVLDRLVDARLLMQRTSRDTDEVDVEIAHESLLQSWGQCARWIDESRDERRLIAELEEAASLWERRGRRPTETWNGAELAAVRQRIARLGAVVPRHVEAFLAAGEERQRRMRKRARIRWSLVAFAALAITALSVVLANKFRAQKLEAEDANVVLAAANAQLERAAKNLGSVDLVFLPFDSPTGSATIDPALLPNLSWSLHRTKPQNQHEPGPPYPPSMVHVEQVSTRGERIDRVHAPGGTAFLRIDGRGRDGQTCAPTWVRLQALPGFADGTKVQTIEIPFPTCAATAEGMVAIPAGPFIYGGVGEVPTRYPEYAQQEHVKEMPDFSIDRTEVSNAMFAPFAKLTKLTGYPVPTYPENGPVKVASAPDSPLSAVDAFEAEAFCRYMGKRLPTDHEWTKAARGGLTIGGVANPSPRRLYPWGPKWDVRCSNIESDADGHEWVAPVTAYPCGASPYGVLNLAGNVAEWISHLDPSDVGEPLREVRGGAADSPLELEQASTIFRNSREDRQFTFAIGVRCVAGGRIEEGDPWVEY